MSSRGPFLAVGHCTRDEFPEGPWRLGGSALYAAATIARLGERSALVTRVGPNERDALAARCADVGVELHALPSGVTTTFAFTFDASGHRSLRLRARAKGIALGDVPPALRAPRAVVLASVAHELDRSLFGALGEGPAVLTAQGYLREWDAAGAIRPRAWEDPEPLLRAVAAVVVSDEDLGGDETAARGWARSTTVALTLAERGAKIMRGESAAPVPAFPAAVVVDQTGAGDAFSAALALALGDGQPIEDAARFASAAASFAVEGKSTDGLADRSRVEARLRGTDLRRDPR